MDIYLFSSDGCLLMFTRVYYMFFRKFSFDKTEHNENGKFIRVATGTSVENKNLQHYLVFGEIGVGYSLIFTRV